MRRRLLILTVVFLLAAVLMAAAFAAINPGGEALTYEVKDQMGDESLTEGLTVTTRYDYWNHAYWFSNHEPFRGEATDTDFRYYINYPNFSDGLQYRGVIMDVEEEPGYSTWEYQVEQTAEGKGYQDAVFTGLEKAYYELYSSTAEGELRLEYIRYADYCDYYPLAGYVDVEGARWNYWNLYGMHSADSKEKLEAAVFFNNYFRIPVLEDDHVLMVADRQIYGAVAEAVDVSESRKGADWYQMETVGITTEDRVYFTFDAHTGMGNLVDTSLIPGGYGLYVMDISEDEDGYRTGELDSLRTVCGLDPEYAPRDIWVDEAYGLVVLQTEKDGGWYLQLLDDETFETLQLIRVRPDREGYSWLEVGENFLACITWGEDMSVYSRDEQGLYSLSFQTDIPAKDDPRYNFDWYGETAYAFDGTYLAVASRMWAEYMDGVYPVIDVACGYSLAIYGAEGLAYFANYESSLEPEDQDGWYGDRKIYMEDIQIQWN